jgi:hypothetical protein
LDLAPDLWQILIYFAFPGTPLYKNVLEEGRYLSAYRNQPDYRKFDGFSMHFKHEHFKPEEIEDLQQALYRKAFETLGPSLLRAMRTWFEGYLAMKASSRPLLRQRAERMRRYVRSAFPAIYPAIRFGPNRERRAEARRFLEDIVKEFGSFTLQNRLACWVTVPLSLWTWIKENLGLLQQPRLLRREYRF